MNPDPIRGQERPASTGSKGWRPIFGWMLAGAALLGLCLAIVVLAVPMVAVLPGLLAPGAATTTPPIARRLVSDSLGLREAWSRGNVHLPSDVDPCVVAADAGVAFVDFSPGATEGDLTALDVASGDVRWVSGGHSTLFSLGTDGAHVFVASNGRIQSYAMSDGNLVWESERLPAHADYLIAPGIGAYLDVFTSSDDLEGRVETFRRFNAEDGLLVSRESMDIPGQGALLIRSSGLNFWEEGEVLRAAHRATGRVAWQATLPGTIRGWPILTGDLIILRSGLPGPLVALNQSTGETEWLYDHPVASNLALRDGQVLALLSSGDLVAVDIPSGTSVGFASFSEIADTGLSMDHTYCIALSGDRIFVYFGDGAQLIALEWMRSY